MPYPRVRRWSASFVMTFASACGGSSGSAPATPGGTPPSTTAPPPNVYKSDDGSCFEEPVNDCPPDDGLCNPPAPMPVDCPPNLK